jgi:D-tyrosyl-tRNA(Tyr) deacylase
MRAVVQRVSCASVSVDAKIVGEIQVGFLILLGIGHEDAKEDSDYSRWENFSAQSLF